MGKIKVLSQILRNQIAAGEVVERPASVVKELVENSLDADAENVIVEVKNGGKSYLSVQDDGSGMDSSDVKLALERYATSKIDSIHDLNRIYSFGFRGEALSSIAAVAKMILKSRVASETAGTCIKVQGGRAEPPEVVAAAEGTHIVVQDLFYNIPARRKYLKTDQTELQHITQTVTDLALAHPRVAFKLISNGKTVFDLPKAKLLLDRIYALLGKTIAENLITIYFEGLDFQINGFIGKPETAKTNRNSQFIFINGRPVQSNLIAKACYEGYGTLMTHRSYPVFVLNLDLDPLLIDVNVHPRKTEVKFANPQEIYNKIKFTVKSALEGANLTPQINLDKSYHPKLKTPLKPPAPIPHPASYRIPAARESRIRDSLRFTKNFLDVEFRTQYQAEESGYPRLLGQIHASYLVLESENGLLLIDQHAAHERFVYEKLKRGLQDQNLVSQRLLVPINIDLSHTESQVLMEHLSLLENLGFEIEAFSGQTYMVTAIPEILKTGDLKQLIVEVIADLQNLDKTNSLEKLQEKIISTIACRSAVKFNDQLSVAEQKELIRQIEQLDLKNCPHGRPVQVELTLEELLKFFKRK